MPPDPEKLHKVMHTIEMHGTYPGMFTSDLQEDDGKWYLVFEWTTNHDGEFPSVRHEIDPSLLMPSGPKYVLSHPVCIDSNPQACDYIRQAIQDK